MESDCSSTIIAVRKVTSTCQNLSNGRVRILKIQKTNSDNGGYLK